MPYRPKVVLAEDEDDIRELLGAFLRDEGYLVVTVADGIEALEAMTVDPPDLLLSDVNMPRMSGPELIAAMRRETRLAAVPVLLLTAGSCDGAGAAAVLPKPIDLADLFRRIDDLIAPVAAACVS